MSVGDLKDYGNKGNNFPWQLKMLQGLDALLSAFTTSKNSFLAPQQKVTTVSRVTTSGGVADGAYSVSIANVGTTDAAVKSAVLKPGETITFNAGALNNTLDAIDYTASATAELLIITVE